MVPRGQIDDQPAVQRREAVQVDDHTAARLASMSSNRPFKIRWFINRDQCGLDAESCRRRFNRSVKQTSVGARWRIENVGYSGNARRYLLKQIEPLSRNRRLDLLKEIAPRVTRVAYIFNPPAGAYAGLFYGSIEPSAARFGIETALVAVNEPA